jgi:Tfp pilus assembly PilM family ATPase
LFGRRHEGWLGIDWGARTIKLACLEREGDELRLARKIVVRHPGEPSVKADGRLAFREGDFPTALAKDRRFRQSKAACVLPMNLVDLRSMTIPDVDTHSRRMMIVGEIEDLFPEETFSRVIDYWDGIPGSSHRSGPIVHVISMHEAVALRVAQTITRSGPICQQIDALPLAMGRAIEMIDRRRGTPHLGLDWGYTSATLTAFRGRQPLYSRMLRDCGIVRLASALAEMLGVTIVDAEQLLMEKGLPGHDSTSELQELAAQVMADGIRTLIDQLETTLSYVEAEWPGTIAEGLWLFGGAAAIPNMASYLSDKTGLDVRTWSLPGSSDPASEGAFGVAAALSALAWDS